MIRRIESITSGERLSYKYLFWVSRQAWRFGVVGVTYLLDDGSIKVIAEGEYRNLIGFVNKLSKGKLFSLVENFFVSWQDAKNEFKDFAILSKEMEREEVI